jgi:dolichyl-phosphate-mannose--protein O-mannosyl transferase
MDTQGKSERLSAPSVKLWWTVAFLWIGTLAFLLAGMTTPDTMLFDEPLYVNAARSLQAGAGEPTPYGPPLGLLLISQSIRFFGDSPLGWRIPGAVLGAFTVVGVFLLLYVLLDDFTLALTAAILALLNNMLYVLSRVAMMDIYLVAFAIWGVLAFTAAAVIENLEPIKRRVLIGASGFFSDSPVPPSGTVLTAPYCPRFVRFSTACPTWLACSRRSTPCLAIGPSPSAT